MRPGRYRQATIACLLIAFGAACAPAPEPPTLAERLAQRDYRLGERVDSVSHYRVQGWSYLDARHLVIHDHASRRYLVTLAVPCSELFGRENVGFTATANRLTDADQVMVRTEGVEWRCPIETIHRLEPLDALWP